jgi:ABC-type Fe3+/spermidine/putrescine transport system ATPase subunit
MPATLKTTRLSRRFRGEWVLDQVSMACAPGSVTAVVGESGSGKTVLMRLLAGLDRPTEGVVELDGAPITRMPAWRRGFGMVQQDDRLFPRLTLRQNVALPLQMRGVKRSDRAAPVQAALDIAQIGDVAEKLPSQASRGEAERAILARAAVSGPDILLLDEPFGSESALAPVAVVTMLQQMRAMLGCTIVLATRHAAPALALCDQVVVLRHGEVEQAGLTADMFYRPKNIFVAALLGDVNELAGVVEALEADWVTVRLDCGPVVEALRGGVGLEAGKPCVMVLRPDTIAVAPVPAHEMGEGAIDARLLDLQFWGDSYRLKLLIGTGAELVVRRPAIGGLRGLVPGRLASIAWQAHHAMAFLPAEI